MIRCSAIDELQSVAKVELAWRRTRLSVLITLSIEEV
jgi:hypothetical protein